MASGLILDPRTLLRTAPLLSSTGTLLFSFDQSFFLDVFLRPSHRTRSNEILPSYFRIMFQSGVVRVLGFLTLTLCSGGYQIRTASATSKPWYTAGTLLAASHLLFVPAIAPKVQAISEDWAKGESTRDLEGWLAVHRLRTWTVDVAAWVCFVVGATIKE